MLDGTMPKIPAQRRIEREFIEQIVEREINEALRSPRSAKGTRAGRALQKPPLAVQRGVKQLRVLAFGPQLTRNPDLPDKALADLEAAEKWLDEVVFGRAHKRRKV